MNKEKLLGRFYFNCTSSGNLIGEFSNNISPDVFTESANLIKKDKGPFIGTYISIWQEDKVPRVANLTIGYKFSKNNKIYLLEWTGKENYSGEGMLMGDILIGNYSNA
jgi:hypothetical protein